MNNSPQPPTEQPPTRRKRLKLPAELQPEHVTGLIDTREQVSADIKPLRRKEATLTTGDYSALGLEHVIAIERKSLEDYLACVGRERERFERECQRLLSYPVRAIVIEASWQDLERGGWRSHVTPAAAIGSALGWIAAGIPVILAGDHERAGRYIARLIFLGARRRWREVRPLVEHMIGDDAEEGADD